MKKQVRISKEQLFDMMMDADKNINGNTFVSINMFTSVSDLVKPKSNPFYGATKNTVATVQLFQEKTASAYEAKVNRELEKEGKEPNFQVGKRAWGERIKNTPIIEHKGAYYLYVFFNTSNVKTTFFYDNKEVSAQTLKPHRRAKNSKGQGGLENQVTVRTFKFESIASITINKTEYIIM